MRNLKRALSLALASVMLLGMMVIGTSAATFTDADEIVNTEAATITAGLGLFAGSEGKFNPTGKVTRAQMATIIVKMLYGSEINADSYKGSGAFSDVASFEGGWAEGYINLCANIGIVAGYGDGTFKPGQELTTAEAVTMLLKALKVDAGEGTWPMTVMSAAEKIELYEDMVTAKPTTNEALTRDQLSVLVWNALNYSPDEKVGYTVAGKTYDDYMSAYLATGVTNNGQTTYYPNQIQEAKKDTLAATVFNMKPYVGRITANQATSDIVYTEVNGSAKFNLETGLDMIGRLVTVYYDEDQPYETEKKPGVAYCVVDESTTTVVVSEPEGGITERRDYRSAFGSSILLTASNDYGCTIVENYAVDESGKTLATFNYGTADGQQGTGYYAKNGTYVIKEDEIIAYIANPTVTVAKVTKVDTTAGQEEIRLSGNVQLSNSEDDDVVIEYAGIAKDDIVSFITTGDFTTLTKLDKVTGKVSATSFDKDSSKWVLTVDGTNYKWFGGNESGQVGLTKADDTTGNSAPAVTFTSTYDLYVSNGKLFGYTTAAGSVDLSEIVFVNKLYDVVKEDNYGTKKQFSYAQVVDMEGKEDNILYNICEDTNPAADAETWTTILTAQDALTALNAIKADAFFTYEKSVDNKGVKEGIMMFDEVDGTYNKNTAPIFAGVTDLQNDPDKDEIDGKSKMVYTAANGGEQKPAYITANTKFIKVGGDGSLLETAVAAGSIKWDVTGNNEFVLLSKNSAGNTILEVLVVTQNQLSGTTGDIIYVADTAYASQVDGGYNFEVYNVKTGEATIMKFDAQNEFNNGVGFYEFSYDEDEKVYNQEGAVSAQDGAYMNEVFESTYNGMLTGNNAVDHLDASKAIIVDTRDEKNNGNYLGTKEVAAIETLEEMNDLEIMEDENYEITMDVLYDLEEEEIIAIFIKSITNI